MKYYEIMIRQRKTRSETSVLRTHKSWMGWAESWNQLRLAERSWEKLRRAEKRWDNFRWAEKNWEDSFNSTFCFLRKSRTITSWGASKCTKSYVLQKNNMPWKMDGKGLLRNSGELVWANHGRIVPAMELTFVGFPLCSGPLRQFFSLQLRK